MVDPYRVIVIDDDPDVANYTKTVLEKRLSCIVIAMLETSGLDAALAGFSPDVVVTDIEMPGISGLDLIAQIHESKPGLPVIVMTAHASVDYAVAALRNKASEFFVKPVNSADLISHVKRLAEEYRLEPEPVHVRKVVLAIGAHPDDVEIGVGGILAAHSDKGDDVTVLTLSRGERDGGIRVAWNESSASANRIGAHLILEDEAAGHMSLEHSAEVIRRVVDQINPTVIYVHSPNDRNQDHRIVNEATIMAAPGVSTIACYQSSTSSVDFRPNRFVSVEGYLEHKLEMIACFAVNGERARYLDPDTARASARYWSRFSRGIDCEPLEVVRDLTEVSA